MTKLLIRIFIGKEVNYSNPIIRSACGKLAGTIGIITNLLIATLKVAIGLFSNSIAVIADGVNNISDASSSIITLVGFKLSEAPEDEDHPFGHARIEYITGLIVSFLILLVGVLLLSSSIDKIINPSDLIFSSTTVIILILSIVLKLWQMFFYMTIGEKINSKALRATATDSRNDVISTIAVLISLLVWKFTQINLDGIFGTLVALFIIFSGITLIKETSSPLLGESPPKELVKSIIDLAKSYPEVLGTHDIIIHNYGHSKAFATLHVEVDGEKDIFVTHDVVDTIENRIKAELGVECTIHLDPIKLNDPLVSELSEIVSEKLLSIDGLSDLHDLRIVPGPTHTKVIFDLVRAFNCDVSKSDICKIAESTINQRFPDFSVVITFDNKYS